MRRAFPIGSLVALCLLLPPAPAHAQELDVRWTPGPATAVLGDAVAEVEVGDGFIFAGPEDTRKIMEYTGNTASKSLAGLVTPAEDAEGWFVVFDYDPIGYVSDKDRGDIDADAILASIKAGTEKANEKRRQRGEPTLSVIGWHEPPRYDPESHNLTWALLAESSDGGKVVNHNTRLLGRHGYMSSVLVAGPEELERSMPRVEKLLASFRFTQGNRYTEYLKGDKVATYGLAALVAGGAGAAAAKFGLFKFLGKFVKVIVLGALAAAAALFKRVKSLFGGKADGPGAR